MKSARNKTIDFSLEIGEEYLNKCVKDCDLKNGQVCVTVLGDFYTAIKGVKDNSIDLLIVDPPYNLTKNFHGKVFKEQDYSEYADYTAKWITEVKSKLKKT